MISFFKKFSFLGFIVLVFGIYFSFSHFVNSGVLDNISGYAWGASWLDANGDSIQDSSEQTGTSGIIFNCASDNAGTCGNSNYGLNIDSTGNLTGYAWSSDYGWLKFGGLSGFPVGNGTTATNAKLSGTNVTGWARFCSAAPDPTLCYGTTVTNSKNGGWDGWVSLSGTSYGITLAGGNTLTGYAWGGDDNGKNMVGWINFSNVSYTIFSQAVGISANGQTGDSLNPVVVASSSPINLAWTSSNMTSCTASGDWSGSKNISGTQPSFIIANNGATPLIKIYTLNCTGTSGSGSAQVYVSVTPALVPTLYLVADTAVVYPPLYQTTLRWTSNVALHGCIADGSTGNISGVSSWSGSQVNPPSSNIVSVPYNPTRYGLSCLDSLGNTVNSIPFFVSRGTLPETVALSSSQVTPFPFTTTLSWTTSNIVSGSCLASGGWSGSVLDTGSQNGVIVPQTAPALTTYTLSCTGLYSGQSIPVSIQLNEKSGPVSNKKTPHYLEK